MSETWLVLETSGKSAKIGLARREAIVRAAALDDSRRHARDLASAVDAILKAESLRPHDLTGIVVGRGPGSYTGLRVGLMSAKALAYALDCELRAVGTFAAIAIQAPAEAQSQWVIADALQGQLYAQQFTRIAAGWVAANELRIVAFEDWYAQVADAWISGPGLAVYDDRIAPDFPRVPIIDREPRVENLFAVGIKTASLYREEVYALEPLYLRGSSAEEKAKGK